MEFIYDSMVPILIEFKKLHKGMIRSEHLCYILSSQTLMSSIAKLVHVSVVTFMEKNCEDKF